MNEFSPFCILARLLWVILLPRMVLAGSLVTAFRWWLRGAWNIQEGVTHSVWQLMLAVFWGTPCIFFHAVSHPVGPYSPCCFFQRVTQTSLHGSWLLRGQTREPTCTVRSWPRSHSCPFYHILRQVIGIAQFQRGSCKGSSKVTCKGDCRMGGIATSIFGIIPHQTKKLAW